MKKADGKTLGVPDEEILLIGIPGAPEQLTLDHDSAYGLCDYSIVIVDPEDMSALVRDTISEDWEYDYKEIMERRLYELKSFLTKNKIFICILREYIEHSTGSLDPFEASSPITISNYDFLGSRWGANYIQLTPQKGKIRISNGAKTSSFLDILKKITEYEHFVKAATLEWKELGHIKARFLAGSSQGKCVAFEAYYEGYPGKVVFLRPRVLENLDLLIKCAKKELARLEDKGFKAESWTENYTFPGYSEITSTIRTKENERDQIIAQLAQLEASFKQSRQIRDMLLNGKGEILRETVKTVFNELGIDFEDGPEGQDDLILKENDSTILVCEVKGSKTSAKKPDVGQVMSWVSRVVQEQKENEEPPKGLLVVNAWCHLDIAKRKQQPFPPPTRKLGENYKFCLMTTIQLFNIWCAYKRGELEGGKKLIKQILKTVGVFKGYEDIPPALNPE